jgi:phosphate transport system ATP-binding protein
MNRSPELEAAGAPPAEAPPVIVSTGFHLWYGGLHALKGIDLAIRPRRITAIIGPSGCGKSSFLRSLNRMNDRVPGSRVQGRITFDGEDIYGPGVDVVELRRRVGMVFQKPVAFPMSVYDNVAYGPRLHRLVRSRAELDALVEASLRQAGLWDEVRDGLRRPAAPHSGGQLQRLAIARALAVQPEVILLDEPTSAIDPIGTARIEDTLQQLAGEYTIVLVTHNLQQAARISHRTAFFLAGELVEEGPTDAIFHRPRDRRTEDYLTGRLGQEEVPS